MRESQILGQRQRTIRVRHSLSILPKADESSPFFFHLFDAIQKSRRQRQQATLSLFHFSTCGSLRNEFYWLKRAKKEKETIEVKVWVGSSGATFTGYFFFFFFWFACPEI